MKYHIATMKKIHPSYGKDIYAYITDEGVHLEDSSIVASDQIEIGPSVNFPSEIVQFNSDKNNIYTLYRDPDNGLCVYSPAIDHTCYVDDQSFQRNDLHVLEIGSANIHGLITGCFAFCLEKQIGFCLMAGGNVYYTKNEIKHVQVEPGIRDVPDHVAIGASAAFQYNANRLIQNHRGGWGVLNGVISESIKPYNSKKEQFYRVTIDMIGGISYFETTNHSFAQGISAAYHNPVSAFDPSIFDQHLVQLMVKSKQNQTFFNCLSKTDFDSAIQLLDHNSNSDKNKDGVKIINSQSGHTYFLSKDQLESFKTFLKEPKEQYQYLVDKEIQQFKEGFYGCLVLIALGIGLYFIFG